MKRKFTSDDLLVSRVRTALAMVPDVNEKRMFGSVGFLVRGRLCVSARAGRIMCRIDPARYGATIKRRGCRTVVMKGRLYRGYVYVDAEALTTRAALSRWLKQALEYNRILVAAAK